MHLVNQRKGLQSTPYRAIGRLPNTGHAAECAQQILSHIYSYTRKGHLSWQPISRVICYVNTVLLFCMPQGSWGGQGWQWQTDISQAEGKFPVGTYDPLALMIEGGKCPGLKSSKRERLNRGTLHQKYLQMRMEGGGGGGGEILNLSLRP